MTVIDRRDCSPTSSCLPRSSSIDSVAEWGIAGGVGTVSGSNTVTAGRSYGLFVDQPPPRRSPSPLLGSRSDRLSLVSPSIGRRVKGHRAVLGESPNFSHRFAVFHRNGSIFPFDRWRCDIGRARRSLRFRNLFLRLCQPGVVLWALGNEIWGEGN